MNERHAIREHRYNRALVFPKGNMAINVLFYGLGPIGAAVARQVASRQGFKVVGGIDIDPAKSGRDVGDVIGLGKRLNVRVVDDAAFALKSSKADVVVLCTSSSLKKVLPQVEAVLAARKPIVSTTEELSYPVGKNRSLAKRIDDLAKKAKVAVLGTGVNPGFTMDALPIMLTGVCERVDSLRVDRVQDARSRRLPFQLKIGAGLTTEQFQQKVDDHSVRHVGLTESVTMIADALGWKLDKITDEIQPKIAGSTVQSEYLVVDAGYVCGIIQDGVGWKNGKPLITLHMEAYLGAAESYDAVTIEGNPRIHQKISGGVHGDVATASITVNSIPKVLQSPPGLRTMRDMMLPSWFNAR
ncbi:MAG TPA: hypothetical protein VEK56_03320 [Vicinamibacterales bacterium]|nr:hypothetical protein [Vicinamibacterales bacterium]